VYIDGDRAQVTVGSRNVFVTHENFYDQQRIDRGALLGELL
jgi:hypothetical protein